MTVESPRQGGKIYNWFADIGEKIVALTDREMREELEKRKQDRLLKQNSTQPSTPPDSGSQPKV